VIRSILAALFGFALVTPGEGRDLSIGFAAPATSFDPHYHADAASFALHRHVFEPLLFWTPDAKLAPALARSWTPLPSGMGWELQLDPAARFSDGTPVTAADAAASLVRAVTIPNSPGRYTPLIADFLRAEAVDAHTLRLHTRGPAPLLPGGLAAILVVPERIAREAATAAFNTGSAAIGSGPYRLRRYQPGEGVDMEGHEAWWAREGTGASGSQIWRRVTARVISSDAARTAALRAGTVDLIEAVPPRDTPVLAARPDLRVASVAGARLMYVALRQGDEPPADVSDLSGRPLSRNPLQDDRVRRALSLAIDRAALAAQTMDGQAIPTGQVLPAGFGAADPELHAPIPDRAAAQVLLADAGWGGGFRMTLSGTNNRFVNDEQLVQAIAAMWRQIGVDVRVEVMPAALFFPRLTGERFAAALSGWVSGTGEPNSFFASTLATRDAALGRGSFNAARYSNPRFDALLDAALSTIDPAARHAAWRQATRIALAEDVAVLPLFHQINVWAMRRGLSYEARVDSLTLAMGVRPVVSP
jgi:peptide/nickel transport system substrate-binding protein